MNEHHRRHIASTFHHIDGEFAQIEGVLSATGAKSPLSQYRLDLQPMQERIIADYLQRIRREMLTAMERFEIGHDGRRVSAAWTIRNRLLGVSIALAEMDPHHLRGYGDLTPEDKIEIARICTELDRLVGKVDTYLRTSAGQDLSERLARLPGVEGEREALATLEQVIARHHLLEFRPALEMVISRLESNEFEIAFFGRVSSGKSSLLNHILGRDVLPVGVTPVTAVPTRVRTGKNPEVIVHSELSPPRCWPLESLADFVTEEANPRNTKKVNTVDVLIPSDALAEGVAFVDTPGIGSLATSGAAQTVAYLPRCDLGVLLLDAGSTLNEDDLRILQALWEAAVPPMVLLSKCDLLSPADRDRVIRYVTAQVREKTGLTIQVFPVSIVQRDPDLAGQWFQSQVLPLLGNHRAMLSESIQRKIAALRESVAGALHRMLDRDGQHAAGISERELTDARQAMEAAQARIAAVAEMATRPVDRELAETIDHMLEQAAARITTVSREDQDLVLKRAAIEAMALRAEQVRSELVALGAFLNRTVNDLKMLMGGGNGDPVENASTMLSPLPSPQDSALAQIPVVRPARGWGWWPAVARWSFRRRARKQCWWPINDVMRDHAQKLRGWTKDNLIRITDWYAAHTDPSREQLRSGTTCLPAEQSEASVVKADLELLLNHGMVLAGNAGHSGGRASATAVSG